MCFSVPVPTVASTSNDGSHIIIAPVYYLLELVIQQLTFLFRKVAQNPYLFLLFCLLKQQLITKLYQINNLIAFRNESTVNGSAIHSYKKESSQIMLKD